ncbi:hypothetical protein SORBI_3008G181100 [Sorghum bicolor]|uniref:Uncharacterized protein n=1 Tax=Sorghum bicolor TaxID=4558 RepID=A0A1B6PEW1_SORBI|nr:hypothetical protein SORBI_3008G181100 [Sorghum bicolor]
MGYFLDSDPVLRRDRAIEPAAPVSRRRTTSCCSDRIPTCRPLRSGTRRRRPAAYICVRHSNGFSCGYDGDDY